MIVEMSWEYPLTLHSQRKQTPRLRQTTSYNTFLKASDTSTSHFLLTSSLSPTSIPPVSRGKHFDTHSTLSHIGMSTWWFACSSLTLKADASKPYKIIVELHFLHIWTFYPWTQFVGTTSYGHSADGSQFSISSSLVTAEAGTRTKQQGVQLWKI